MPSKILFPNYFLNKTITLQICTVHSFIVYIYIYIYIKVYSASIGTTYGRND